MASDWSTRLADELKAWIQPITDTDGDPGAIVQLLAATGWRFDLLPAGGQQSFIDVVKDLTTHATALVEALESPPDDIEDFLSEIGMQLVPITADLVRIANAFGAGPPPGANELPGDILNWLTIRWLASRHRTTYEALVLLGIVRYLPKTVEQWQGVPIHARNGVARLVFQTFFDFFTKPVDVLKQVYWPNGFADNGAGAMAVASQAWRLGRELGLSDAVDAIDEIAFEDGEDEDSFILSLGQDGVELGREFVISENVTAEAGLLLKALDAAAGGPGVLATPFGEAEFQFTVGRLSADLKGTLKANPLKFTAAGISQTDSTQPPFGATLIVTFGNADAPAFRVGSDDGLSVQLQSAALGATVELKPDRPRALISTDFKAFRFKLNPGKGDGFLAKILPPEGLGAEASFGIDWSTDGGLAFRGGGLSISLPTHIDLGPIEISQIILGANIQNGGLPLEISATISAALGPLEAVVERLGILATLSFPDGGGNIGPAKVDVAFKPPNGVGLSIDVGVVVGGGYLYIDTERGQYAGALELVVADWLTLTAIGLISTKMPDGTPGFSLLVIITATFGSGIQLGYGFMLVGVGGLLGLNRSMLFQPLMDGVRTGAVNGILFPTDVIANAPRIISDLQAIFPVKKDTFLVGPMAKLSWATLITISLGVIIEIPPGDVAILGVLELVLPDEEDEILLLRVNFAGALEFSKKRLYFFASIYDSHILFITLQGEMGLLVDYSDHPDFVVTVGGFHPQFKPPPLPFPAPKRIQLDILNEDYARISADTYFAITTNTAQIGAHVLLFFGFSAVSVKGEMGFDALFQFSPFHFTIEVTTSVSATVFGVGMFSLDIDITLEGTTPWHVYGKASISLLFFSVDVPIDRTWGDQRDTRLPPIAVLPIITGELGKVANWRAQLPQGSNLLVTLRKIDPAETALVLHPVGTLRVSQRAVPLDLTIDKVGNQAAGDANRFRLDVSSAGLVKTGSLQEPFAPAQFRNFSDADKLSQAAFAPQDSGLELSAAGTALASGTAITRNVRYDLTVVDTQYRRFLQKFFVFVGSLFAHFIGGGSVSRSTLSAATLNRMQPFEQKVAVSDEVFAVAKVADNTAYSAASVGFSSQSSAQDHLDQAISADPNLKGQLHVVGQYELAA